MASHPGFEIEDYVNDCFTSLSPEEVKVISSIYRANPEIKDYIENALDDYDHETQNWRDYRNSIQSNIDEWWPNEEKMVQQYLKRGASADTIQQVNLLAEQIRRELNKALEGQINDVSSEQIIETTSRLLKGFYPEVKPEHFQLKVEESQPGYLTVSPLNLYALLSLAGIVVDYESVKGKKEYQDQHGNRWMIDDNGKAGMIPAQPVQSIELNFSITPTGTIINDNEPS